MACFGCGRVGNVAAVWVLAAFVRAGWDTRAVRFDKWSVHGLTLASPPSALTSSFVHGPQSVRIFCRRCANRCVLSARRSMSTVNSGEVWKAISTPLPPPFIVRPPARLLPFVAEHHHRWKRRRRRIWSRAGLASKVPTRFGGAAAGASCSGFSWQCRCGLPHPART